MTSPDRTAALAALLAAGARTGDTAPDEPPVERTGEEVYAGGDVRRLLIRPASLTYVEGGLLRYANARPGDVILITARQAKRLDSLATTVDPDSDLGAVEAELEAGLATDEQLEAMTAAELIAYVTQNPDERDRVRDLEQARKTPRKTVLTAVEPTPDADADADLEAAARAGDTDEDDDE